MASNTPIRWAGETPGIACRSSTLHSRKIATRTTLAILAVLAGVSWPCYAQAKGGKQEEPAFRAPFVLKLRIDNGHYYEQKFGKVPYVADGDVYLFAGDDFGINAAVRDGQMSQITYQPSAAKADVEFSFFQQRRAGGFVMMLVIQNRLKRKLYLDALMTVPGKSGILKTDILPIPRGLTDYESWPQPIVQLVLRGFRFAAKPDVKASGQ